ncbi:MAG: prepilin-type N-terminal cleavage/methylation domain-containing protein [Planctomycetota bacterium]
MNSCPRRRRNVRAFTLVELLVVTGIIAVLIAVLVPALISARNASRAAVCMSNIKQLATAHTMYLAENRGYFIQPGLGHSSSTTSASTASASPPSPSFNVSAPALTMPTQFTADDPDGTGHANEQGAWINTLKPFFTTDFLLRSPADDSPHWEGEGLPVRYDDGEEVWRRTSYGINSYLTRLVTDVDGGPLYERITQVPQPSATVHFLIMAPTGSYAAADHPHPESWGSPGVPNAAIGLASQQMWINLHGGEIDDWNAAESSYGFLDGHAEIRSFREVWQGQEFDPDAGNLLQQYSFINSFDPQTAR